MEIAGVNDACKQVIQGLVADMQELWLTMLDDGVENVIYLGFYHPTSWNSGLGFVDYGMELITEA